MIAHEARRLLRGHRYGALCTLSKKLDGYPFGSITPYLADHDGSLLIFVSTLAEHTRNIRHDPRVSLITHDQFDHQIQSQGRVTVIGNAMPEPDRNQAGLRYLRYFPEAQSCYSMQDFSFYRIRPIAIRYIGGFGKIHWIDMENYAVTQAEKFAAREDILLAELNTKQHNFLLQLLHQNGIDAAEMQAIGMDCDGIDVRSDVQIRRLNFAETIAEPVLSALATLKLGE
ncbi:MAG: pyridoxamine 5'-phosphate oxidase family protein [Gallionella sp.]